MNINTKVQTPPKSSFTAIPAEAISNERVQQIILRRKKSALIANIIFTAILTTSALLNKQINIKALIIAGTIFIAFFSILFIVNAANYPSPKPSYRQWNKVVYIYLAKLVVVFNILRTANNFKKILNPMHGYKDPSAISRPELLLDTAMSVSTGYFMYKSLKPANYIEEYYKQQDLSAIQAAQTR